MDMIGEEIPGQVIRKMRVDGKGTYTGD